MRYLNPPTLAKSAGYSHVVEAKAGRTLYVSGQIATDASGAVVGEGDIEAQARQVFANLEAALAAGGASLSQVVKITVFMTDVAQLAKFRMVRDSRFGANPPASSLVEVSRLVRPELLIEIEAVAVIEA